MIAANIQEKFNWDFSIFTFALLLTKFIFHRKKKKIYE
jgi:hypothetical protein